jgi:hypothetical protein
MTQIRTDQVPSKLAELVDEIKVVFAPPRTVIRRRPGLLKQRCFAGSTASIRRTGDACTAQAIFIRTSRRRHVAPFRIDAARAYVRRPRARDLGMWFSFARFQRRRSTDPAGNRELASEFLMTGLE